MALRLVAREFFKVDDIVKEQSDERQILSDSLVDRKNELSKLKAEENKYFQMLKSGESLNEHAISIEKMFTRMFTRMTKPPQLKKVLKEKGKVFPKRWEYLQRHFEPLKALKSYLEDEEIFRKADLLDDNNLLNKVALKNIRTLSKSTNLSSKWLPGEKEALKKIKEILRTKKKYWLYRNFGTSRYKFREELRQFEKQNKKYRLSKKGKEIVHLFDALQFLYYNPKKIKSVESGIKRIQKQLKDENLESPIHLGFIKSSKNKKLYLYDIYIKSNLFSFIDAQDNEPLEMKADLLEKTPLEMRTYINYTNTIRGSLPYSDYKFFVYKTNLYSFNALNIYSDYEQKLLVKKHYFRQKKGFDKLEREIKLFEKIESKAIQSREPIPEEARFAVWRRDQGRCVKCGSKENLEFDHIIPVSKGGSNTERNIQLLCEKCNREKSDKI